MEQYNQLLNIKSKDMIKKTTYIENDCYELIITYAVVKEPTYYEEGHGLHLKGGDSIELSSVELNFNIGALAFQSFEILPLLTEEQINSLIEKL